MVSEKIIHTFSVFHGYIVRQFLSCQFLNVINQFPFFLRAKRKCCTFISSSSRTTNTMYISFGNIRKIIINNQRQFININSSGSNIGSHHYFRLPRFKVPQCRLSRCLAFVSVNSLTSNPCLT